MIDAAFQLAANPRPHRVLGMRLEPLSIGHLFLLREFAVGFLDDQDATDQDLVIAVFVCSQPYRKSAKSVRAWWAPLFCALWGAFARKRFDFPSELFRFHDYIADQLALPKTCKPKHTLQIRSPLEWRLLVMLMCDFGFSEAVAMETCIAKSNALWTVRAELNGHVQLKDDRLRTLEEFAAQREKLKQEGGSDGAFESHSEARP